MRARHRFFAPEVVQSSAMDCGPAALKSLLDGFGIPVSYGRLREACQTDVDGTSIDTLEGIAVELGLEAEQILVPTDHVLLPAAHALPALAVAELPNGAAHFVIVWSRHGRLVQVMDPAFGRRWISETRFLQELYQHTMLIPAAAWREWAVSDEARGAIESRLDGLKVQKNTSRDLIGEASTHPDWRALARLDAALRATDSVVRAGGIGLGDDATRVLKGLIESDDIPEHFWSARPADDADEESEREEHVWARGAVLVRVRGRRPSSRDSSEQSTEGLSPELVAAREEPTARPGRELFKLLRADGLLSPIALTLALFVAAGGLVIEALLFRGLLDLVPALGSLTQRVGAFTALAAFVLFLLILELPIAGGVLRLGRRLEGRLRIAFLEKIPRLGDRYFRSRLISDMAERNHSVHGLRNLPNLGAIFMASFFELALTVAGIIWLAPASAPVALLAGALALGLPLAGQPVLMERDLRVRSHLGILSRFYLDSLLGLVAVRAHAAGSSIRNEHEAELVQWTRARFSLQGAVVGVEGIQALTGFGAAAFLLIGHLDRGGDLGSVLLLVYWALNLPFLGLTIAQLAWQYPAHHNVTLRLTEPLGAPTDEFDELGARSHGPTKSEPEKKTGVALQLRELSVRAGGHLILDRIDLDIDAGSHVAVVGHSGAGKSSLFGVLLGWHRASHGEVLVDGVPLDRGELGRLRSATAWIDPSVQVWNRSLSANLLYGNEVPAMHLEMAIDQADLREVLESLPQGEATLLGENGGLVSGGEGQRVRLGRAMMRSSVRLVLLDEPFRGLGHEQRATLLARCRELWKHATLLCVTHGIAETDSFDRVLVMESGKLVEDGTPESLGAPTSSRYRSLRESEEAVRAVWTKKR